MINRYKPKNFLILLNCYLVAIIVMCGVPNCTTAHRLQSSYDHGKTSIEELPKLPPLESIKTQELFNNNVSDAAFNNLTDQDLVSHGVRALNNSEIGSFLMQSEEKKMEALQEYKFHDPNSLLSSAQKIETDPLKEISGDHYTVNELSTKVKTTKTCSEGVEFEIDIVRQLILNASQEEQWGDWQDKTIIFSGAEISSTHSNWFYTVFLKKHRKFFKRKTVYSLHIKDSPEIIEDIRATIAAKLGMHLNQIQSIKTPYKGEGNLTQGWNSEVKKWDRYVISYQERNKIKKFVEKGEYWQVVNKESEKLVEATNCYQVSHKCLENGSKVFFNELTVNRPCWKEQITNRCRTQPIDGCKYLTDQGCHLDTSICTKKLGNICLQWQRSYQCYSENKKVSSSLRNNEIFCSGGQCHTPVIEKNLDIHNVGYVALLNEIRKDMQKDPVYVFKGEANGCNKFPVNFLNCCQSMKGWGKDVRLGKCSAAEKDLALKKDKGLCYTVGTYCVDKDPLFKQCLRKKTIYCCFASKFARVFQEQGKAQLGIGFGSAELPNCRGFTIAELQRIDFTQFNLEELFADLMNNIREKRGEMLPNITTVQMPLKQGDNTYHDY